MRKQKKVVRIDPWGDEAVYESALDAARCVGGTTQGITACCYGGSRGYGYRWRFLTEAEEAAEGRVWERGHALRPEEVRVGVRVRCDPLTLSLERVIDRGRCGRIAYVHSRRRYVTVAFRTPGGELRESFFPDEVWAAN